MAAMPESSVDAIVTDPPYGLGFMGKAWDTFDPATMERRVGRRDGSGPPSDAHDGRAKGRARSAFANPGGEAGAYDFSLRGNRAFQAWCEAWARESLRVLKPGGHLVAFGGTRTYHRLAAGVEDAGFEIRDQLQWLFGSGFPKSKDLGDGRGTALKPGHEPIVLARKPFRGSATANVAEHGTGGLNIDACKLTTVSDGPGTTPPTEKGSGRTMEGGELVRQSYDGSAGRWPANVVFDEDAAAILDAQSGELLSARTRRAVGVTSSAMSTASSPARRRARRRAASTVAARPASTTVRRRPRASATPAWVICPRRRPSIPAIGLRTIWRERLILGTLNVIAGQPGAGKSSLTALIAAELSRAGQDARHQQRRGRPRLGHDPAAHGGRRDPRARPRHPAGRRAAVPRGDRGPRGRLRETSIRVRLPRPDRRALPPRAPRQRPRALRQLAGVARRTGAAIVGVHHTTKTGEVGGPNSGMLGTARAVYVYGFDPDDEDRRALSCEKINGAAHPPTILFEHEVVDVELEGGATVSAGVLRKVRESTSARAATAAAATRARRRVPRLADRLPRRRRGLRPPLAGDPRRRARRGLRAGHARAREGAAAGREPPPRRLRRRRRLVLGPAARPSSPRPEADDRARLTSSRRSSPSAAGTSRPAGAASSSSRSTATSSGRPTVGRRGVRRAAPTSRASAARAGSTPRATARTCTASATWARPRHVVGEVGLAGKVIPGTLGWRGREGARPPPLAPARLWEHARPLAAAYRVPVTLTNPFERTA
jgi:hypothetical protein